jgi:L-fuconolactonase
MTDRDDWLDLTIEQPLEPNLPICDPHHHLWEYPGSRYLLDEFRQDISRGHRIVSTVFVECLQNYRNDGPEALMPVGETEYVERLVSEAGEPCIAGGIVGFADLGLGTAVSEVLDAHAQASTRFRGIRHASAWHPSDNIHNAHTKPPDGLLMSPGFREGFACLMDLELTFDAWLYHPQIPELIDLARTFPKIDIILNHMAGPLGIGPYSDKRESVFQEWQEMMIRLSSCDNVFLKLGGRAMTMSGYHWHQRATPPGSVELAQEMGPYFRACIEHFGVDRCMFESNFPVDKASCSYTVLWNAFKRISQELSASERAALLHETAVRVYRLEG